MTPIAGQDRDLDADRQHALDAALGERKLPHRVQADPQRERRHHEADHRTGQGAEREVDPAEEVDRLLEQLGKVIRLASPQQEEAGEQHAHAVQRDHGQREDAGQQERLR